MTEIGNKPRLATPSHIFSRLLFFAGLLFVSFFHPSPTIADEVPQKTQRGGCPDLIDLIKELTPAVVNISIERHLLQSNSTGTSSVVRSGIPSNSKDQMLGKDRFQTDSIGSGFICDTLGNIVTNAHVVEGAGKILVTFSTGKVAQAKLVAIHPKVDLALIHVTAHYPLQKAKIGDSTNIQVGEWVLAVGNPFGLGRTVTVGIVSGKGRFIGLGPDDDFIQTDASINPGNSGGPLFNMAGEVVGVNTAMIAVGKGIGFSIPSNHIPELFKVPAIGQEASRGWLGIYVEDLTDEQAGSWGLTSSDGTIVDEVMQSSPAQGAGLKKGDFVLEAGGAQIRNGRHLSKIVSALRPGDLMKMTVLRENQKRSVEVILGKPPE